MPRLSEQFLEELRARNPITDLIGSYVTLKRAGSNLKGLCPFHSEKSPSFVVYEKNNSYYCFGCGAGGDAITFVRSIDNLDYMDAVRFLAQRAGMPMPEDEYDNKNRRVREKTLEINREIARFYYQSLSTPGAKTAREYLAKRQLTPETVRHFGLGYAPEDFSLLNHLREKGFTKEELIAAGMKVSKNGNPYDQFHGRLIFPIIDVRGNVIGFGGRRLSDEVAGPKYLNSNDTPAYKKTNGVYALNFAKDTKDGSLILCEGYMDVISLHQAGFTNAVASCGTAFTEEQARLLSRYAGEIILAFDADGPGQKAIARGINILKQLDVKIRVLKIPDGKDPDEYIRKNKPEAFRSLLRGAMGDTEFRLDGIRQKYDLTSADGRVGYIKETTALLAAIASTAEREVYAEKVAAAAGVSKLSLLTEAENLRKRMKFAEKKQTADRTMKALSGFDDTLNPEKKRFLRAASAEEALLAALIATPELTEDLLEYLPPEEFVTAFNRRLYEAITSLTLEYGHFDIGMLSEFSPAEIGRIQSFVLRNARRAATPEELHAVADVIREEKHKPTGEAVASMDDEDFKKLIADIGKNKK